MSSGRPKQVFMARVKGLPATTVAVFSDKVVVKHPIHQTRHLTFDDMAQAKRWLQSLTVLKRLGQLSDVPDVDDARYPQLELKFTNSSYFSWIYFILIDCILFDFIHLFTLFLFSESESDIEDDSPKPKRFKRSSKERKLAMWNIPESKVPLPLPNNKRSATQRQLHIRKEQLRREEHGRLVRELNFLITPEGYAQPKVIVLKQVNPISISNIKNLWRKISSVLNEPTSAVITWKTVEQWFYTFWECRNPEILIAYSPTPRN